MIIVVNTDSKIYEGDYCKTIKKLAKFQKYQNFVKSLKTSKILLSEKKNLVKSKIVKKSSYLSFAVKLAYT